ncbi:hypothetical protein QON05_000035 [Salmonella enterica]|nr:hypothetical protein [Salmonella enterica]EGN5724621.1 hypothetical protein [Salmonella enterica]EHB7245559.1 hypothetical protein [Salmonella enterica]EIG0591131.1 hypothetical protein [Salmonella enterica]EJD7998892.1 hypothetical protein [Salmonella enterica]
MVDDVTTLPVMFVTIYGMNELSKKHLGTQENEGNHPVFRLYTFVHGRDKTTTPAHAGF